MTKEYSTTRRFGFTLSRSLLSSSGWSSTFGLPRVRHLPRICNTLAHGCVAEDQGAVDPRAPKYVQRRRGGGNPEPECEDASVERSSVDKASNFDTDRPTTRRSDSVEIV